MSNPADSAPAPRADDTASLAAVPLAATPFVVVGGDAALCEGDACALPGEPVVSRSPATGSSDAALTQE